MVLMRISFEAFQHQSKYTDLWFATVLLYKAL